MPHIHDKIDFTVEAFIVRNNKVLLRLHDKHKIWLSVGGHIELDEDPVQAVIREVREEVGLDIKLLGTTQPFVDGSQDLIPPKFLNRHHVSDSHEHVTLVYFAQSGTDILDAITGREQSDGLKWFTAEELDDPQYGLKDNVRFYAGEALKTTIIT